MELPDTFNSWFLITELHVWMLMIKSMELGADGRRISYFMVEAMWGDVTEKSKKLGVSREKYCFGNPSITKLLFRIN